jgi:hypothetical protein
VKTWWLWMQSNRIVASRLIKSMMKYGTSVMPGGKFFIAAYCRTEIIKSTGISLRNKTMAVNYCFFNQNLISATNNFN